MSSDYITKLHIVFFILHKYFKSYYNKLIQFPQARFTY